jgi:carboxymethylenebutenolidase
VSVLKHEGKVPILFGSTAVTVGTITRNGYLARPDLTGQFPTVVVVPDAWGITSSVKDVCRRLARWGVAAITADPYRGDAPARSVPDGEAEEALRAVTDGRALGEVTAVARFVANPAGFWSNAEHGFGILGLGSGGRIAALAASRLDGVAALALVAAPLHGPEGDDRHHPADLLGGIRVPVIGAYGKDDDQVPVERIMEVREEHPGIEWLLYPNVGHGFFDDHADGFDERATRDAVERLAGFFAEHLPGEA